jgi:hypothetical protein
MSSLSANIHGEAMEGCVIVTDGCLHTLERDADAQRNFFDDEKHFDYNGWKSKYCKKGLYFFSLDGRIVWYSIDVCGSWADGKIMDHAQYFIDSLPDGCWILGDSAFAKTSKVRRTRKVNENLPLDPFEAHCQLELERVCGIRRLSSE